MMNPLFIILLLFVGIPLFELYWLIEVGSQIGAVQTIVLTILTAIIGGYLVRQQGISTTLKMNAARARGEMPALEMLSGVMIFFCGLFLLLPGFFSDTIGFLLLIPPIREMFIIFLLKRLKIIQTQQASEVYSEPGTPSKPRVIEGEFHRDDS